MPGVDLLMQLGRSPWIDVTPERLDHAMQRARFDLAGVASVRALAGDIQGGNEETRALLEANPRARGWLVVNPTYIERSTEEMRRRLSSTRWLGALIHPGRCAEALSSASTRELLNAYRRFTKPVLVRVENSAEIRELEALAAEFNTIKFIAGGAGGDDWSDCMYAAKRVVNIFLEPLSGGTHRGKLETMTALLGPHRILFASNYPEFNPGASLGLLMDAKLTDGEKQAVLLGSAVRLFELNRTGE